MSANEVVEFFTFVFGRENSFFSFFLSLSSSPFEKPPSHLPLSWYSHFIFLISLRFLSPAAAAPVAAHSKPRPGHICLHVYIHSQLGRRHDYSSLASERFVLPLCFVRVVILVSVSALRVVYKVNGGHERRAATRTECYTRPART